MELEVLWMCVSGNESTACGERSWRKKESNWVNISRGEIIGVGH